jgi:heme/copper-type cytochrome/quinol oxidase subunit 2
MSRPLALLFAVLLLGVVIVVAATEQNDLPDMIDSRRMILNWIAQAVLAVGLTTYCGFAALRSTQHVSSPQERSRWLLATIGLNVLGSCWYFVTTYQSFRKAGQGGLMRFQKNTD